jgi:Leucine-rich repeat (LRR) protein
MPRSETTNAKPRWLWRQRSLRFSMRTLLIVVTVLSVPLGWVGWKKGQVQRERATITWVKKMGGGVDFDPNREKGWWEKTTDNRFGLRVWRVDLNSTQVSDISPLAELKNLGRLVLTNTQVSDLSPLAELKNLEWLSLHSTQVSDLSPLADLKNLRGLFLNNTHVSDLSPLTDLKNLKWLYLQKTQVSDLSPLAELKNLAMLRLDNTQVSDLSPLAGLKNLGVLDLRNTPVSDEQVQELRQALPGCMIGRSIRVAK